MWTPVATRMRITTVVPRPAVPRLAVPQRTRRGLHGQRPCALRGSGRRCPMSRGAGRARRNRGPAHSSLGCSIIRSITRRRAGRAAAAGRGTALLRGCFIYLFIYLLFFFFFFSCLCSHIFRITPGPGPTPSRRGRLPRSRTSPTGFCRRPVRYLHRCHRGRVATRAPPSAGASCVTNFI
jgi:hypothetical protein